jgi:hypothetical protein
MIRTPSRLSQLRTVLGIVDLIFPGTVLGLARTQAMDRRSRKVVQILGVRQLVQAAVTGSRPTGTVLVRGALVDAGHAVSMAALALLNRRWRRAALVDAAIAALLTAAGLLAARQAPRPLADSRSGASPKRAQRSWHQRLMSPRRIHA